MQFELLFNYQGARDLDENCLLVGSKAVPLRFIRHRRARRGVLGRCPGGAARGAEARVASAHGFSVRRVTVRNQRSRWGSCSVRGTISLNWRLVQTPVFVRDYIVLHELAHLKEMNHSRRYWREVARLCPEFEQAERWLKQ